MKFKRRLKVAPTIPYIAFADIAWQLVIFFLVASSFAHMESFKLDLPGASHEQAKQPTEPIMILAGENLLQVKIDGKDVPLGANDANALCELIARRIKGKKTDQERAVVIQGRPDLTFQRDLDIMSAVQRAGGILMMMEEK